MAGNTTYLGIQYPTSTDYVKDGALAIQTVATGFDTAFSIPTFNAQTGTSYTFALSDIGKTVTASNASASNYTIPPQSSVVWPANTELYVRNLGAGVVTIAGGAGVTVTNAEQTIAQYGSIRLTRTASNAWTVTPDSGSPAGLDLIASTAFTSATTLIVDNVFSANYKNYMVVIHYTNAAATNNTMKFRVGGTASSTGYSWTTAAFQGSGTTVSSSTGGNMPAGRLDSNGGFKIFTIMSPAATENTWTQFQASDMVQSMSGYTRHSVNTAYDGFEIAQGFGGTGVVTVYGMRN